MPIKEAYAESSGWPRLMLTRIRRGSTISNKFGWEIHDVRDILELYRSMSFSHQREYAIWIEAAKQAETRKRRIEKSIEQLRAKKPRKK